MICVNVWWVCLLPQNILCAGTLTPGIEVGLHCIALYWTVLYCIVLYWTVLYCIVLNCIVLYWTVLYCIVLYWTVFYCVVLHCIVLHCVVTKCIVLHCVVTNCIVLHCVVLNCVVLLCVVLYWTVLYCIQGGVNGDMSVTAFVLIAMLECPCMEQVGFLSHEYLACWRNLALPTYFCSVTFPATQNELTHYSDSVGNSGLPSLHILFLFVWRCG